MQRREKEALVTDIHEKLKEAKAAILTDFTGLNVQQITQLRRTLKKSAVEYKVVKNTLLRRASQNTDIEKLTEHVVGPIAIALAYEDPVAPAKILIEFSKAQPALEIKAGMVTGIVMTPKDIKTLASLPSKEVLVAKFISLLKTYPTRFVRALNTPLQRFISTLDSVKKAKEKA
ncbi:MAG: 50S ribosomal protein L10 [Deltaproteobacteria bacterium]|nr:50S ribosomal protein L10 [Deltaproteobacteria bacterium]